MVQTPMLDGGDQYARFAVVDMRVNFCKLYTQAQQLQPRGRILDFTRQVRQRALVHRAGIRPLQLVAREQVLAECVRQRVQLLPRQAELRMHGKTVETLDLSVSDVAVGDHRQRDDARCGLRAVHGIAAHHGSPLGPVGRGSVEDVAQPGLLAVALLASAMLVVGVCELRR